MENVNIPEKPTSKFIKIASLALRFNYVPSNILQDKMSCYGVSYTKENFQVADWKPPLKQMHCVTWNKSICKYFTK